VTVAPGQSISHYRLIEKIGEGGMGVVWKAQDTVLGRTVAIKVLPADVSQDENRRQMFFEEARSASAVSAAHIVQVYEFGHEGDLDFIVMEYVEGQPLNKLLPGKPLPPSQVADYGAQIAHALARAHRAKLIHRDLKPANLLVTNDGEVKVVDFGLATLYRRVETTLLAEATTRTEVADDAKPRKLAGTIPYMSPEQVRLEELDSRTDIFSLGAILYEMSTGQRPFQGSTNSEVMQEILKTQPVPVHDLVPKVPLELDRVIAKAMAPRRGQRYQDAEELATDLKQLGQELQTGTSPSYQELQQKLGRERRRARGLWTAAGALALVFAAIVVWQLKPWKGPGVDPGKLLILPLEVRGQEEGATYLGQAFAETLASNLAVANLDVLPVPVAGELEESGTRGRSRAAIDMGAGRLLIGALTREGDVLRASLSLVDASANRILWGTDGEASEEELRFLASDLSREVASELGGVTPKLYEYFAQMTRNPELASSPLYLEVLTGVRHWDWSAIVPEAEKLVEAFPDDPDALLLGLEVFGVVGYMLDEGENAREKADELLAKIMRLDPGAPWEDLYQAAFLEWGGEIADAIDRYTRILEREDLTSSLRSVIVHQRGYARGVRTNLDPEGGLRDLEEAIRLEPTMWEHHRNYAWALVPLGRWEEAVTHARQAWMIAPSASGVTGGLAEMLFWTDRYDEAVPLYAELCEEDKNQEVCAKHAFALHETGREDEARVAAAAAEILEDTAGGIKVLADYWSLAGNKAEAVRLLRRRIEAAPGGYPLRANFNLTPLRGDPEFEALCAEQWETAVELWGEECASKPNRASCSLHALALHLTGREREAQVAATKAAAQEATAWGCQALAWYHGAAKNRDEVIRYLKCRAELGDPNPSLRLGEHVDYLWISGDPEFDAIVAEIGGYELEGPAE
jgi:tetratricopeptide (TPR) repeat protein/predicted Ser/Thr protein kinase